MLRTVSLPSSIFTKALYDRRRGLMGWAIGILLLTLYVGGFYPVLAENEAILKMFENAPASLRVLVGNIENLTTAEGFFDIELFNFFFPLFFSVVTIGQGLAAIVGEEQRGTLDVLLANPISRTRHVLESAAAIAATSLLLSVVTAFSILLANALFDLQINAGRVVQASLALALFATLMGCAALAAGAWLGEYNRALGATVLFGLGSYLIYAYADLSETLDRLKVISVFYYYEGNHPILNGIDLGHAAVLVAVAALLVGLSVVGVNRRDLGV